MQNSHVLYCAVKISSTELTGILSMNFYNTEWRPGMGPPPQDFRQGNGPPRGGGGGGPPPMAPPPMQGMPQFAGYEQVGGFGQSKCHILQVLTYRVYCTGFYKEVLKTKFVSGFLKCLILMCFIFIIHA